MYASQLTFTILSLDFWLRLATCAFSRRPAPAVCRTRPTG